jgi:hypothetical protein
MAKKSSIKTAPLDSGDDRFEEPGLESQASDLPTEDNEPPQERNAAETSDHFDLDAFEGEVFSDDDEADFEADFSAIHETDLHTEQADHDADEADAPNVHMDWDDGSLDRRSLTAPPPRKGMRQRWIRYLQPNGQPDELNWSKKLRLGWRPRSVESLPTRDRYIPTRKHSRLGQMICVAGNVLCEIPEDRYQQLQKLVKQRTAQLRAASSAPHKEASAQGMKAGWGAPIVVDHDKTESTRKSPRGRR